MPQAIDVTRKPQKLTLASLARVNPDGSVTPGVKMSMSNAGCSYRFTLPNEYSFKLGAGFSILVPAISSNAGITEYYNEQRESQAQHGTLIDLDSSWGAEQCFLKDQSHTVDVRCRNGRFYFEVSSGPPSGVFWQDWQDKAVSQIVRTVAAKTR